MSLMRDNPSIDLFLADCILFLHAAVVAFVVLGLIAIWLGRRRAWRWVASFRFRLVHLLAIGLVASQAILGLACPLTVWEGELRLRAGQPAYGSSGFVRAWVQRLIFHDWPDWVFTVLYVAFFLVVLATYFAIPPRRRARKHLEIPGNRED